MRKIALTLAILILTPCLVLASGDIERELKALKERVAELEKKLAERDKKENVLSGIELGIGATMVFQGNFNDDHKAEAPYDQSTDGSYSFDIEFTKSLGRSELYMHLEGGDGEGRDREIATWTGINGDAYDTDSDIRLSELTYSYNGNLVEFTFGKLDMTAHFDENEVANDETTQFLAGGFVNNPGVEFPDYGPGIVLKLKPAEGFYISLGYESINDDGDPDWDDLFSGGFFIGEVGFSHEKLGNYRVYYWVSNRDHEDFSDIDPVTGDPLTKNDDNKGLGVSLDKEIVKDKLRAFIRMGWQDEDLSEFEAFYSGGFELTGSVFGKDYSFGLAYSLCKISDEFEEYRKSTGSEQTEDEHHLEAYYKVTVSEHLEVSLDYQFIKNPAGYDDLDDVHIMGLRTQLNF